MTFTRRHMLQSTGASALLASLGQQAFAQAAALENATGHRYPVGLTPVETLGPPFLARAGVRIDWSRAAAAP